MADWIPPDEARLQAAGPKMFVALVETVRVLSALPITSKNDQLWAAYSYAIAAIAAADERFTLAAPTTNQGQAE